MPIRRNFQTLMAVIAIASLIFFNFGSPLPTFAAWTCNNCVCDRDGDGRFETQNLSWPGDGDDTNALCAAVCTSNLRENIPNNQAQGETCERLCECCSGTQPDREDYETLDECKNECRLQNEVKQYGEQAFECAAGAAPPEGEKKAPAAPQAPAKYEQGEVVIEIENPLGEEATSIPAIIGRVINAALGISGSIAILMVIYGGVTWLTSGGSTDRITKGKNVLVWATIGLAIIFGAYSLVNFILSKALG